MNRRIAPPFVKESARSIQMVEILFVDLATPETHVCDFKVRPEMAGRVAVGQLIMNRPACPVGQPTVRTILMEILGMLGEEFGCFGPEGWDRFWCVIERDGEPIGFVVVLHVTEDVIVNVAEEVHLGLDSPVVLYVGKSRMFVEETTIPSTHLVV